MPGGPLERHDWMSGHLQFLLQWLQNPGDFNTHIEFIILDFCPSECIVRVRFSAETLADPNQNRRRFRSWLRLLLRAILTDATLLKP